MSDAVRLRFVFSLLMSFLMSFLMSAWVTWLNIGLHADFILRWREAFLAAWPVAFAVVILCAPRVHGLSRKLLDKLTRQLRSGDTPG